MSHEELLAARKRQYERLVPSLEALDDRDFRALIGPRTGRGGWGESRTAEFRGASIFVKRIPLTDLEASGKPSTSNVYGLPTFYQYGVGSAGFGTYRELAAQRKTTAWALDGQFGGVPLLYHHRVLDLPEAWGAVDPGRHASYVTYWGSSEAVSRYMHARAASHKELVMVLEHFPETLAPRLLEHPDQLDGVLNQLFASVAFLSQHGFVHFDAHFENIVTDGGQCYLADLGLALAADFELAAEEADFLSRHLDYDYGEIIYWVGVVLGRQFAQLPEEERRRTLQLLAIEARGDAERVTGGLIRRAEDLAGLMPVHETLLAAVQRYRAIMLFMNDFYVRLRSNPRKDTPFEAPELRRLLGEAGIHPAH